MSYAIGIDVGGTSIKSALIAPDGTVGLTHGAPTPTGVEPLLVEVAAQAAWLESQAQQLGFAVIPEVGLVVPGIVDETKGIGVLSANLGWQDAPLRTQATTALCRPVGFGHDVRAGALAETRLGAHGSSLIYVAIGTGVASVLVLDGQPLVSGGWAGEIGQSLVPCPDSGKPVVFEQVTSASAISRRYLAQSRARRSSPITDLNAAQFGSREVFERAAQGDQVAFAVIDTALDYLAQCFAQMVCVLGPLPIVIGGGLSAAGDALIKPLKTKVNALLALSPMPNISTAQLGSNAQVIGAGLLAHDLCGETRVPGPVAVLPN